MYAIYTLLLTLALILALPYYVLSFKRYGSTIAERLGFLGKASEPSIWIHAVSVGEIKAVERLLELLRQEFPKRQILVSTTTLTGQQLVRQHIDVDRLVYFPLDIPLVVRRSLKRLRPELVIIAETEIWPNFLRECKRSKIPVIMINGRISDKSHSRYLLLRSWLKTVLDDYETLGMQSEMDAERIRSIGAAPHKVVVFGNIKYDLPSSTPKLDNALSKVLQGCQPLFVAASTATGEEQLVMRAYSKVHSEYPNLKMLIAPRLPDRFNEVAELLRVSEFEFRRRSEIEQYNGSESIILLDSIGELSAVFKYASLVFIGGTLVPRGGHNILEAARFEKPVLFGPYMENFREMAKSFLNANAAVQVANLEELATKLKHLIPNPSLRTELGQNAGCLVNKNSGATEKALRAIRTCLQNPDGESEKEQTI